MKHFDQKDTAVQEWLHDLRVDNGNQIKLAGKWIQQVVALQDIVPDNATYGPFICGLDIQTKTVRVLQCNLSVSFKKQDDRLDLYIDLFIIFPLKSRIAYREFDICGFQTPTDTLSCDAFIEVSAEYREIGLGKALLELGEDIKRQVAKKFARVFDKKDLISYIRFDSDPPHWTPSRTAELAGYSWAENHGLFTTYKKVERL